MTETPETPEDAPVAGQDVTVHAGLATAHGGDPRDEKKD